MVSPACQLLDGIFGKIKTQLIAVAASLNIADLLKDGPRSIEALAKATGTKTPSLYRIMRALVSMEVFAETTPRHFTSTAQGELLRTDVPGSLRDYAIMHGSEWTYRVWPNLLHSLQTNEQAFEDTFGASFFQYLGQHPDKFTVFNDAMTSSSTWDSEAVCEAYDFSGFRTLVDIAGGNGFLLSTILKANPALKGILFEQPSMVEGASERLHKQGVYDRCQVVGGDFFTSMPEGADAYITKRVIHDWDDERAIKILSNCRDKILLEGKILVVDIVIPLENMPGIGELSDINMLGLLGGLGGKERTEAEFRVLFSKAGFKLTRVVPTAAWMSIVEGVPV